LQDDNITIQHDNVKITAGSSSVLVSLHSFYH
jgi:hypothetical protein